MKSRIIGLMAMVLRAQSAQTALENIWRDPCPRTGSKWNIKQLFQRNMKPITQAALAMAAFLGHSLALALPIVYDNGAPLPTFDRHGDLVGSVIAQDFVLASDQYLDGGRVYIYPENFSHLVSNMNYWIFSDLSGTPGAVLASGSDSASRFGDQDDHLFIDFEFESAFEASGGMTYWLGLQFVYNQQPPVAWSLTDANATANGHVSHNGDFGTWTNSGFEHAFFLTAGNPPPHSSVAEPGTLSMLLTALMILVLGRNRRAFRIQRAAHKITECSA